MSRLRPERSALDRSAILTLGKHKHDPCYPCHVCPIMTHFASKVLFVYWKFWRDAFLGDRDNSWSIAGVIDRTDEE